MAKTPKRVVRATTKYTRTHTKDYHIRCNKKYDADIIAFLDQQANVAGYIKAILHRQAEQEGFGHLRVANTRPAINPKAGEAGTMPGGDAREDGPQAARQTDAREPDDRR